MSVRVSILALINLHAKWLFPCHITSAYVAFIVLQYVSYYLRHGAICGKYLLHTEWVF
jgi:hypothetical protein